VQCTATVHRTHAMCARIAHRAAPPRGPGRLHGRLPGWTGRAQGPQARVDSIHFSRFLEVVDGVGGRNYHIVESEC